MTTLNLRSAPKSKKIKREKKIQQLLLAAAALRVRSYMNDEQETYVTTIRLTAGVEVGVIDGFLCFWNDGREVRVGPLTPDQAEKLCEDLGYEAVQ